MQVAVEAEGHVSCEKGESAPGFGTKSDKFLNSIFYAVAKGECSKHQFIGVNLPANSVLESRPASAAHVEKYDRL